MFTTATFSDTYLQKLLARFDLAREDIVVMFVKPDIPKLYLFFQTYKWPMSEVSFETLKSNLDWLMFWLRFVIPRFSTVIPQRVDGHVAHGAIRFG